VLGDGQKMRDVNRGMDKDVWDKMLTTDFTKDVPQWQKDYFTEYFDPDIEIKKETGAKERRSLMADSCIECVYWDQWFGSPEQGNCRRYPPKEGDYTLNDSDWCGEFKQEYAIDVRKRKKYLKDFKEETDT